VAVEPGWSLTGAGHRRAIGKVRSAFAKSGSPVFVVKWVAFCSSGTPQRTVVTVEPHNSVRSCAPAAIPPIPLNVAITSPPGQKACAPVRAGP